MKKQPVPTGKLIGALALIVFAIGFWYFFFSTSDPTVIPAYVSGQVLEAYEWAQTPEGSALLEQIPCYCGCKYEGHRHARHCFWRDDGTFDKHGLTCSVCLDIEKKVKQMNDEGVDVCTIRNTIDAFYLPNKHLGTDTPMPEGCVADLTNIFEGTAAACESLPGGCGA